MKMAFGPNTVRHSSFIGAIKLINESLYLDRFSLTPVLWNFCHLNLRIQKIAADTTQGIVVHLVRVYSLVVN